MTPSSDDFLARYGDVLDDRVAEYVEELLEQRAARHHHRHTTTLILLGLLGALLTATIVLRDTPAAVAVVWVAATPMYAISVRTRPPRT